MQRFLILIISLLTIPILGMEQPAQNLLKLCHVKPMQDDIFRACHRGDLLRLRELLKEGVDVDSVYPYNYHATTGCTPLMIAAYRGHLALVVDLVKRKADIHRTCFIELPDDTVYHTPFGCAVMEGHNAVAEALLQGGSNIHHEYYEGMSYFFMAIHANKPLTCSLLAAHGLDISIKGPRRWVGGYLLLKQLSAFDFAAGYNHLECLKNFISHCFILPMREQSFVGKCISSANALISSLPYWNNKKPATSGERIRMLLFCLKEKGVPSDVRKYFVCKFLSEDLIDVLISRVGCNKPIPTFALDLMINACYDATVKVLMPELKRTFDRLPLMVQRKNQGDLVFKTFDPSIGRLFDPHNFEENYGQELRANIRARLVSPYQYMASLLQSDAK